MKHCYKLFGLNVESEIIINAEISTEKKDIVIYYSKCPTVSEPIIEQDEYVQISKNQFRWKLDNIGVFFVRNGNEILIELYKELPNEKVLLYVLGVCINMILQQRGIVTIHGSCICKEGRAIIITGESGAGKSTLSSVFIRNGWSIMTDDIIPLIEEDGIIKAQASFPGQKLWEDCIVRTNTKDYILGDVVREENGKVKYMVDVSKHFFYGKCRLEYAIMLTHGTDKLYCSEINGFAKTDLLVQNLYDSIFAVDKDIQKRQLTTCMKAGKQIRAFLIERPDDVMTEQTIYNFFMSQLEC